MNTVSSLVFAPHEKGSQEQGKRHGQEVAKTKESPYAFLCQLAKGPYCGMAEPHQMIQPGEVSWGPVVGKGAYAVVYLSDNLRQKKQPARALKQLKPAVAEDKVELKFFLLEAHIISRMMHEYGATPHQNSSCQNSPGDGQHPWDGYGLCKCL